MKTFDIANGPAAFIMPHWSKGVGLEQEWLDQTLESIKKQTDPNWKILIADGNSPSEETKGYLRKLEKNFGGKLEVLFMPHSDGPGHARNVAIKKAYESGYPFIMFLDADDIAHSQPVEIARKTFLEKPEAGVVYSTFEVIDEYGNLVPQDKLSQSIVEILESHEHNPPQGKEAWIKIAAETGYTNLTSTTSVRTEIAHKYPFPPEKVSEDYYTWLVYSASGTEFVYTPLTPTKYRIPQHTEGSASRSREGGKHGFYATKCRVDAMGFQEAAKMALERGVITQEKKEELQIKFLIKEAETMGREQELDLAKGCYHQALEINKEIALDIIKELNFENREWIL